MTTKVSQNLLQVPYKRNVIINGNFDIWQRGSSFTTLTSGLTADRWNFLRVGASVVSALRSTDVPTYAQSGVKSNYSLHIDVTTADASLAAGDYAALRYKVEGYDYARIAGGNATLSFWVKGSKTGTHCIGCLNSGADRSYVAEYTINSADTWEKKTVTIPLTETGGTWDYTNGIGLDIWFTLASGTTYQTTADAWQTGLYFATSNQVNEVDNVANNFRIAQVQLEKGDTATPFEFRNYATELNQCHRYFERLDFDTNAFSGICTMMASSTTDALGVLTFHAKRTAAWTGSVSNVTHFNVYDGVNNSVSAVTFETNSRSKDRTTVSATTTGLVAGEAVHFNTNNTTSGYIDIDAEL